jgi:hypothetical protein
MIRRWCRRLGLWLAEQSITRASRPMPGDDERLARIRAAINAIELRPRRGRVRTVVDAIDHLRRDMRRRGRRVRG